MQKKAKGNYVNLNCTTKQNPKKARLNSRMVQKCCK